MIELINKAAFILYFYLRNKAILEDLYWIAVEIFLMGCTATSSPKVAPHRLNKKFGNVYGVISIFKVFQQNSLVTIGLLKSKRVGFSLLYLWLYDWLFVDWIAKLLMTAVDLYKAVVLQVSPNLALKSQKDYHSDLSYYQH